MEDFSSRLKHDGQKKKKKSSLVECEVTGVRPFVVWSYRYNVVDLGAVGTGQYPQVERSGSKKKSRGDETLFYNYSFQQIDVKGGTFTF